MTTVQLNITKWNAAEFERLVLDGAPRVAVFDCDGTLWSGDAGKGFMDWSLEQGLVSRSTADWIDTRHRAYMAGTVSELQICGEMVQIYAGLHEQEIQAAAARYVEEFVRPRVFAEMASLITALRKAGAELWAVSSTNNWVVSAGIAPFGIPPERVLAAQVAVADGIITDTLVDVPTDEGKAASLRRVGLPNPDAVFGNSIHDLAMLEIAKRAFPVNPSPALLDAAARNGWGYFRPQAAEGVEAAVAGE
ncbi:MAG TPA: haloacid dehalogenase-like hydrolase [Terracidiphilus sp.]|nr:haloacid dehalogenase-like hydrolase [Terracidiphilus sp.]